MPLNTRADLLKYAIAHALLDASKIVRGARQGLTVGEREDIGERAAELIRAIDGDPWKLGEALPQVRDAAADLGHSTPAGWQVPAGFKKKDPTST